MKIWIDHQKWCNQITTWKTEADEANGEFPILHDSLICYKRCHKIRYFLHELHEWHELNEMFCLSFTPLSKKAIFRVKICENPRYLCSNFRYYFFKNTFTRSPTSDNVFKTASLWARRTVSSSFSDDCFFVKKSFVIKVENGIKPVRISITKASVVA